MVDFSSSKVVHFSVIYWCYSFITCSIYAISESRMKSPLLKFCSLAPQRKKNVFRTQYFNRFYIFLYRLFRPSTKLDTFSFEARSEKNHIDTNIFYANMKLSFLILGIQQFVEAQFPGRYMHELQGIRRELKQGTVLKI